MYKIAIVLGLVAAVSAGLAPIGYASPYATAYAAPAIAHAPLAYAAPAIAHAPVATSYANTYRTVNKPVAIAAAPAYATYAAPAIAHAPLAYAAPAIAHGPIATSYGLLH